MTAYLEISTDILEAARQKHASGRRRNVEQRTQRRFDVEPLAALCSVVQPGGTRHEVRTCVVEVGGGGCKVLFPSFLHAGTEVALRIDLPGRPRLVVQGVVTWCDHLSGRSHVVGVKSYEAINVRALVDAETWAEYQATRDGATTSLSGSVGVFCPDALTGASIRLHLSTTEAHAIFMQTTGALADLVRKRTADIIVLDLDHDDASPVDLLTSVREHGFDGPVILVSSDPEAEGLLHLDPSARSLFVLKPVKAEVLIATIRDALQSDELAAADASPIYSSAPDCPDRHAILVGAIDRCRELAAEAQNLCALSGAESTIRPLRAIADGAECCGYGELRRSAESCVANALDPARARWLSADLHRLGDVVERLSPDPKPER